MKAMEYIVRTREYLDYLEEHILNVQRAWNEIQEKCKDMAFISDDFTFFTLDKEIKDHDLSKFSEEEFVQYRKAFYPINKAPKGVLDSAWEHHKNNNPHHWENWTQKTGVADIIWIPNCVHMIVDWLAMSYKFGDSPKEYYESNTDTIKIPDFAIKFMYQIFERLEK